MALVDDVMTNPLIGAYIAVTALILLNIFIAILTNTVNRVYEKAVAYIVLQRAIEIVNEEKSWTFKDRRDHIRFLNQNCNPYNDETYHELITSTDDRIGNLESEIKEQKQLLKEISNYLDQSVTNNYVFSSTY